jgi:hypothetical protein
MSDPIKPPSDPFKPFCASSDQPWDVHAAGHLLRRAGFGPTEQRLDQILKQSPQGAVASLIDYDVSVDPLDDLLESVNGFVLPFSRIDKNDRFATTAPTWCVYRMLYTQRALQEKLALFWHNRFATSLVKVENQMLMHHQIDLFRRMGMGSFRDMLVAVGRDPAMLVWLDGQTNRKGHPNENYAREIMELFALGVGNYTEKDIQELARAFTGWRVNGEQAFFDGKTFDDGVKEAFGKRGNFNDESAVDLILEQPAAPRFIARKLLQEFVSPYPLPEHVEHYAKRLRECKWEIKPVLTEILTSRLFFSDWAYRSKIKSPLELVIGTALALGGKPHVSFLRDQAAKMGQSILMPPGVKGWDGGEAWINANTILMRFNFALAATTQRGGEFVRKSEIESHLAACGLDTAEKITDHFSRLLLDGRVDDDARKSFLEYANSNQGKGSASKGENYNPTIRGLLHLIMSSPEYQLA